jgi:AcrR family transcriptional regulator
MTKHRSPDERSEQILTAARHCFLARGYFATKMDDIATECGLSKGGIYFHFDSKEEIFRTLVEQEFEQGMAFIDTVAQSHGDLDAMLLALGEFFIERFVSDDDQPRFMIIVGEMALRDEAIRAMLHELQQRYVDRIAEILTAAADQGQIGTVDPQTTAFLLKALLDGVQAAYAIGYRPSRQALLPAAMALVMSGLGPR